jgi:hypothetical protein
MTAKNYQPSKIDETPRRATLVQLDDDDRAVLDITSPQVEHEVGNITHAELTARYQKRLRLSFEDSQNRASRTLAKIQPARRKVVPNAVELSSSIAFGTPPQPAPIADAQPDPLHQLTDFYVRSGLPFEDAQVEALRTLGGSVGPDADKAVERLIEEGVRTDSPEFNPDRDLAHMSEPARVQHLGAVAQITALLQPQGTSGRDAVITALGMSNLLGTLTAIANGFIQNYSICQTWAQRVVSSRTVNGASSYAQANAQAKRLVAELVSVRDKNPPQIGPGVVNPSVASRSAARAAPSPGPVTEPDFASTRVRRRKRSHPISPRAREPWPRRTQYPKIGGKRKRWQQQHAQRAADDHRYTARPEAGARSRRRLEYGKRTRAGLAGVSSRGA